MAHAPESRYEEFTRVFLRSEREILRHIVILLPNLSDAHDVLQDTAIALWKKFDEYDPEKSFLAWAKGFATLEVKRHLRSLRQRRGLMDEHLMDLLVQRREELSGELEQRQEFLRYCLAKLTADQRKVVEGYYLQAKSVEQLAETSGRGVQSIYKSLQRIRGLLLECVRREMQREGDARE